MSLFITFEGVEGCGKSWQSRALYKWLSSLVLPVILTHEPGGTTLGQKVTRLVKWSNHDIDPVSELLLFNASRAQLVAKVIKPGLENGGIVVCDRFADSTIAYQGYGRGLDLEVVVSVNCAATGDLKPDLTILLDLPVEVGLARKNKQKPDRFEQENLSFHRRVREGYLALVTTERGRWMIIDAELPKDKIARLVREKVGDLLSVKK